MEERAGPNAQVLIVDDDRELADVLAVALNRRGIPAIAAYSALQAVWLAGQCPFEVAVVDVDLSTSSGLTLAPALRDIAGDAPMAFVAMSGHADAGTKARAFACGFEGYLTKPMSCEAFVETLRRHLHPRVGRA
jgi:ActR/RegA family two-component response regulator